jgi:hypothetical protein
VVKRDRYLNQSLKEFLLRSLGFPPHVFPYFVSVVKIPLVKEMKPATVSFNMHKQILAARHCSRMPRSRAMVSARSSSTHDLFDKPGSEARVGVYGKNFILVVQRKAHGYNCKSGVSPDQCERDERKIRNPKFQERLQSH